MESSRAARVGRAAECWGRGIPHGVAQGTTTLFASGQTGRDERSWATGGMGFIAAPGPVYRPHPVRGHHPSKTLYLTDG
jgi:hypothetical protein